MTTLIAACTCELNKWRGATYTPFAPHHAIRIETWLQRDDQGLWTLYKVFLLRNAREREIKARNGRYSDFDDFVGSLAETGDITYPDPYWRCPFARAKVVGGSVRQSSDGRWLIDPAA